MTPLAFSHFTRLMVRSHTWLQKAWTATAAIVNETWMYFLTVWIQFIFSQVLCSIQYDSPGGYSAEVWRPKLLLHPTPERYICHQCYSLALLLLITVTVSHHPTSVDADLAWEIHVFNLTLHNISLTSLLQIKHFTGCLLAFPFLSLVRLENTSAWLKGRRSLPAMWFVCLAI